MLKSPHSAASRPSLPASCRDCRLPSSFVRGQVDRSVVDRRLDPTTCGGWPDNDPDLSKSDKMSYLTLRADYAANAVWNNGLIELVTTSIFIYSCVAILLVLIVHSGMLTMCVLIHAAVVMIICAWCNFTWYLYYLWVTSSLFTLSCLWWNTAIMLRCIISPHWWYIDSLFHQVSVSDNCCDIDVPSGPKKWEHRAFCLYKTMYCLKAL